MNKLFNLLFACAYGLSIHAMDNAQVVVTEPDPLFEKYKTAIENHEYKLLSPDKLSLKTESQTAQDLKTLTPREIAKLTALAESKCTISEKKLKMAFETDEKITEFINAYKESNLTMHILTAFVTKTYFSKAYIGDEIKLSNREELLQTLFNKYKAIITQRKYEKLSPDIRNPQLEEKTQRKLAKLTPIQIIKLMQIATTTKKVLSLALSTEHSQQRYTEAALTLATLTSLMPTKPALCGSH